MEHDLFQGAKKMSTPLHLSVAVPVHNEEAVLPELLRRMRHVLDNIPGGPHEIIFIDDGSSDRTLEILGKAANTDARILIISFSRNFGHQAALTAALDDGDFGLMSRRVVEQLRHMPEHHRYLRGLRSWVGFRQIGIPVERGERHSGGSKYSLLKLLKLASDGIFAFSIVPLRAATILGVLAIGISALYAVYALYVKLFLEQSPVGFTALVFLISFLSGVLLLFLGIIGEYVGRVYEEMKARPHYVIDKIIRSGSFAPGSAQSRAEEYEFASLKPPQKGQD